MRARHDSREILIAVDLSPDERRVVGSRRSPLFKSKYLLYVLWTLILGEVLGRWERAKTKFAHADKIGDCGTR